VHVPFWKFLAIDAAAAGISVPLGFGLAYFFTDQLEQVIADVRRVERWIALLVSVVIAVALTVAAWRRSRREIAEELAERP
jgi:membrane protein DedA with SNARE-associated domain